MKHLFAVVAVLALSLTAQAQGSAVEQLLNNLDKFEGIQSFDGEAIEGTAGAIIAEALTQANIRVTGECEYVGRSLIQKCRVSVTPLMHADENGFNKMYVFKFSSINGHASTPLVVSILL